VALIRVISVPLCKSCCAQMYESCVYICKPLWKLRHHNR